MAALMTEKAPALKAPGSATLGQMSRKRLESRGQRRRRGGRPVGGSGGGGSVGVGVQDGGADDGEDAGAGAMPGSTT